MKSREDILQAEVDSEYDKLVKGIDYKGFSLGNTYYTSLLRYIEIAKHIDNLDNIKTRYNEFVDIVKDIINNNDKRALFDLTLKPSLDLILANEENATANDYIILTMIEILFEGFNSAMIKLLQYKAVGEALKNA